jgi:hypothetical protein
MSSFLELMTLELKTRKRAEKVRSHHEAYGLLAEEVWEYFREVCRKPAKRDRANCLKELVQIAVVAQRAAEDLGLLG